MIQFKRNTMKNPAWQEANQLAIDQRGRGVEQGRTDPSSGYSGTQDLRIVDGNMRLLDCESNALTTRTHCLL